jgi:hypothetical protein
MDEQQARRLVLAPLLLVDERSHRAAGVARECVRRNAITPLMTWRDCVGPGVRRRWIERGAAVVEEQHWRSVLLFLVPEGPSE